MSTLVERHAAKLAGDFGCYDRVVIRGTIPGLCFPKGMASYLYKHNIRLIDYPRWAEAFGESAGKLAK